MIRFFDVHTHVYPEAIAAKAVAGLNAFYRFTCEGTGLETDLFAPQKDAGGAGCLCLGVATTAAQVTSVNQFLSTLCQRLDSPLFHVLAFGGIHQDYKDMKGMPEQLKRLCLRGVKIHPDVQRVNIDDKRLYPLYEAIEGVYPICFHMGDDREEYDYSSCERLLRIKKDFPGLEVIAAHFGGYRQWDKSFRLADLDKIWFDTSSSLSEMRRGLPEQLIDVLGEDRILFGTDYPVSRVSSELSRFLCLELSKQTREKILYKNAERLFSL